MRKIPYEWGLSCAAMGVPDPEPDEQEQERRLQVSLRLKAARYLAGRRAASDSKQPGEAVALTAEELAEHPIMVENVITLNRIRDYEQMKARLRRMELEKLADALGVSHDFLLSPLKPRSEKLRIEQLEDELRRLTGLLAEYVNQQGRDAGRRDLRRRGVPDRPQERRDSTG